jgi:hypothetical protein
MNTRKILNTIGSGAIAWMAGFTITSIAFNSFEGFRNHRAIAGTAGGVAVAVFVISKELLDRRAVDPLVIKQAIATELSIRGSDSTLPLEDKEALEKAAAVFEGDVQRLQGQAKTQLSTLNQVF